MSRTLFLAYRSVLVLLPFTALGCFTPGGGTRMTALPSAGPDCDFPSALHHAVELGEVSGAETNWLLGYTLGDEELREAVRGSLAARGLLSSDRASASFRLSVTVVELNQPLPGLFGPSSSWVHTVVSFMRYRLVNLADGRPVADEVVSNPYTVTIAEVFVGTMPVQLANEGSVRGNIAAFLRRLCNFEGSHADSRDVVSGASHAPDGSIHD